MSRDYDPFKNRHKFQDDVWGPVLLNDLERDVIDTPEFQRLFRTSQMGFVDLVFQTANHTRGAHSIGACHIANRLIDYLNRNTNNLYNENEKDRSDLYAFFDISPAEKILIRLGALLHDISHLPFSHDIERKSHRIPYGTAKGAELKLRSWYGHYDKHDDYDTNPLLYLLVCDHRKSVLANVLRRYSEPFFEQLKDDALKSNHEHIHNFVETVKKWDPADWNPQDELLPQLLFHLLIYEKSDEANEPIRTIATEFNKSGEKKPWHLGPPSLMKPDCRLWHNLWYQPFRHDVIGNTLSADLIDYLTRDPERLGTKLGIDLHLLNYYVLVNTGEDKAREDKAKEDEAPKEDKPPKRYCCAIDLHDHKRGTTRTFLLNDLFRLLDLRQGIHEKAVMHRVVQSANAMLSRALLLLAEVDRRPSPSTIAAFDDEKKPHSLQCEDLFFRELLNRCDDGSLEEDDNSRICISDAKRLIEKLIDRRVYRPLLIIPGDRAVNHLHFLKQRNGGSKVNDADEFQLRTLAAIIDSRYFSSFLLFVCSCIEKYLEGVFDSVTELCKYAREVIGNSNSQEDLVKKAMAVKPSRMIIWATPYKQLYKDPAVVVALEDCVGQIDEICKPYFPCPVKDSSTQNRIKKAVEDADSKYAALWQLYVFISDGLFYTGILQKLLAKLPASQSQTPKRDTHQLRLERSRVLFTVALEVVCDYWSKVDQEYSKIQEKKDFLEGRMDINVFKNFVSDWSARYELEANRRDPAQGLSTVDIKQYIHEFPLFYPVHHKDGRPCRDSRYKFDISAEEEWVKAKADVTDPGNALIKFLEQCGVADPKILSRLEFKQLKELYTYKETRERCEELLGQAYDNKSVIPQALKVLWLAGYPYPRAKVMPALKPDFPQTQAEIRKWILDQAAILRPNVRRRLTEDLNPIIEVLKSASSRNGNAVFEDFRHRVRNEETLLWSDVRVGRLVNSLKRRWNDPEIKNLRESDTEED